jgi:prophage regulatory protein
MRVVKPKSFLRMPALRLRVPFGKSTIYQMVQEGSFPAPRRISARASAWLEDEIDQWIEDRLTSSVDLPPIPPRPNEGRPRLNKAPSSTIAPHVARK